MLCGISPTRRKMDVERFGDPMQGAGTQKVMSTGAAEL